MSEIAPRNPNPLRSGGKDGSGPLEGRAGGAQKSTAGVEPAGHDDEQDGQHEVVYRPPPRRLRKIGLRPSFRAPVDQITWKITNTMMPTTPAPAVIARIARSTRLRMDLGVVVRWWRCTHYLSARASYKFTFPCQAF